MKIQVNKKLLLGAGLASGAILGALIFRRFERSPSRDVTSADIAERELTRWEGLTEHDVAALPILQEYWAATGQPYPGNPDVPWSGAFISYVTRHTGALLPSGAHSVYSRQAWLDRGVPGRYGAYRPTELHVQPGDIVVRARSGSGLTFEHLMTSGEFLPSHGDIVTAVSPSGARAIGGNMGPAGYSTVKARVVPHAGGVITDPEVVAVLRYQPPGVSFP